MDLDGESDVVGEGPDGLGWATNWLPDGRMLTTGPELVRVEHDGSLVRHADLSHISPLGWSEITVDGRGNVYVNTINFDFAEFNEVLSSGRAPGKIALVTPDGEVCEVASELAFPNGMVITPDNKTLVVAESFAARLTGFDIADDGGLYNRRVWAEGVGPDGICLDAEGCIWTSSGSMANDCARLQEGGEMLERLDLDRVLRDDAWRPRPSDAVHAHGGLEWHGGGRERHQGEDRAGARRPRTGARRRLAVTDLPSVFERDLRS